MFQFRIDHPNGYREITTILRNREHYSMVERDADGNLQLVEARFGGSKRGLIAHGDSMVERTYTPGGGMKDYEAYTDDAESWRVITNIMAEGLPEGATLTVTIRDGEPVAESAPSREAAAA